MPPTLQQLVKEMRDALLAINRDIMLAEVEGGTAELAFQVQGAIERMEANIKHAIDLDKKKKRELTILRGENFDLKVALKEIIFACNRDFNEQNPFEEIENLAKLVLNKNGKKR